MNVHSSKNAADSDFTEQVIYDPKERSGSEDEELDYSPAEAKKIIHRIDMRLISVVGVMYCVSLMDRTNLSNAAIAGMTKELKMTVLIGSVSRYSVVTLVFFITYVLCQPPATVLCRKIGPRWFLGAITLLWGFIMIGMGFAKDWGTLAALRVVLGILEAGFFPGAVYLISAWYTRYDTGKRYAFFYLIGCVASAFSGILAFGLMQMEGLGGYGGWSWIFIIEGVITCAIAVMGWIFLIPFPDAGAEKCFSFLSKPEVDFIIRRINRDRSDATPEPFTLARFLKGGADPKIWGFALIFFACTVQAYALAYFLPIILREGMGFGIGASQCLVAPPYAFAGIVMFLSGWAGDKWHVRGPILVVNAVISIIGLALMGWGGGTGVRYFGVFLNAAGAQANIPVSMTYQANNIRGQWKRAFCSATLVGFGGIGGIAGSLVFRAQDAPEYHPGLYAGMACCLLIISIVSINTVFFVIKNKKQARGEVQIEGLDGFRYTL